MDKERSWLVFRLKSCFGRTYYTVADGQLFGRSVYPVTGARECFERAGGVLLAIKLYDGHWTL